jgi:pilus assembly protein CpaF
VFAGPPGSGKTTLLSCTTAELDPSLRVVVAEEVFESDIPVPNVAQMQTRAARADRAGVDLRRLVADAVPRSLAPLSHCRVAGL